MTNEKIKLTGKAVADAIILHHASLETAKGHKNALDMTSNEVMAQAIAVSLFGLPKEVSALETGLLQKNSDGKYIVAGSYRQAIRRVADKLKVDENVPFQYGSKDKPKMATAKRSDFLAVFMGEQTGVDYPVRKLGDWIAQASIVAPEANPDDEAIEAYAESMGLNALQVEAMTEAERAEAIALGAPIVAERAKAQLEQDARHNFDEVKRLFDKLPQSLRIEFVDMVSGAAKTYAPDTNLQIAQSA